MSPPYAWDDQQERNADLDRRVYVALMVYAHPLKHLIHEKFGDGIMSAIDFTGHLERIEDPAGDRVKITMSGKFLPYRRW